MKLMIDSFCCSSSLECVVCYPSCSLHSIRNLFMGPFASCKNLKTSLLLCQMMCLLVLSLLSFQFDVLTMEFVLYVIQCALAAIVISAVIGLVGILKF